MCKHSSIPVSKKPVIARSYWYPKLYWFLDTRRTEEHEMFNRFLKISPVHCKLLRHGENKPNKACDWLFRTHLPASLLYFSDAMQLLLCFAIKIQIDTENKTEIKIQINTIQLSFKNRCSYNDLNRRSQPAVFSQ